MSIYVPIVLGTARKGRQSAKVANFVLAQAKKQSFKSEIIDVKDYVTGRTVAPGEDNPKVKKWRSTVSKADAIIFVSPEYNHSFPGELKLLLDSTYTEYKNKPVGLCTVSVGRLGGARVAEALLAVFNAFSLVSASAPVLFSDIQKSFDVEGMLIDKSYEKRVDAMLKNVAVYAKGLEPIRKKLKK